MLTSGGAGLGQEQTRRALFHSPPHSPDWEEFTPKKKKTIPDSIPTETAQFIPPGVQGCVDFPFSRGKRVGMLVQVSALHCVQTKNKGINGMGETLDIKPPI